MRTAREGAGEVTRMQPILYARHQFPPEIIWLYLGFTLSNRDVEELLAARGLSVLHETIRR
jgi:putative transposase